jgi:nucleotide-binding universal stress UspA family protein
MIQGHLLVPTDFTPVTENALRQAVEISKTIHSKITLLHLLDDNAPAEEAISRIEALASRYRSENQTIMTQVSTGSIFEDIGRFAEELGANLVVMGTHGMKGLQYLVGSRAMRVITNSDVPFLVTQQRPVRSTIENIVLPVDLAKEEKQQVKIIQNLASSFKSKVHLVLSKQTDEFHRNTIFRNAQFIQKHLQERGIEVITYHAEGEESFERETIWYAVSVNADLISIINHHEEGFKNLFGSNFDQNILTNDAQVPVLVYNTKTTTHYDIFQVYA